MRRTRTPYLLLLFACLVVRPATAQTGIAAFESVWSGYITSQDHPVWLPEDFQCFLGCPKVSYDFLASLLDDPANDERPFEELVGETRAYIEDYLRQRSTPAGLALMAGNSEANDTNIACHSYDYVRAATNPLPLQITRDGDILTIRYEEWNLVRTVYLDGREFPASLEPTSQGYSIGRIEDSALVIETRGLIASTYAPLMINAAGGHSDQLRGGERYTLSEEDGARILTLELTLEDAGTLTEPYVYFKRWVATPEVDLLTDSCEDTPGEF